jgi:glycosyltransferase involved in cell wall biosynthesis
MCKLGLRAQLAEGSRALISFLMPCRNSAVYLEAAVDSILSSARSDIELVIVDDGSTDSTPEMLSGIASDTRVISQRNSGAGKIDALNLAFSRSRGEAIAFLDSDDLFIMDGLDELIPDTRGVTVHDLVVVDDDLKPCAIYSSPPAYLTAPLRDVMARVISLPRPVFTLSREIAEIVFPIPRTMIFEDVWISLVVKARARSIRHPKCRCYLYRQHSGQSFGGILDFSNQSRLFRACTMVKMIRDLPQALNRLKLEVPVSAESFASASAYWGLLAHRRPRISGIMLARMSLFMRLKALVYAKTPRLAAWMLKLKWNWEIRRHRA